MNSMPDFALFNVQFFRGSVLRFEQGSFKTLDFNSSEASTLLESIAEIVVHPSEAPIVV